MAELDKSEVCRAGHCLAGINKLQVLCLILPYPGKRSKKLKLGMKLRITVLASKTVADICEADSCLVQVLCNKMIL